MGNRLSNPNIQFLTNSGQPNTGGTIAFYTTGTTTLATVYTNRALGIAAQNPLPLDSAGRMQTDCFLDPAVTYKVILNDGNGVPIWTKDPVVDFAASINASLQVTAGNPNSQLAGVAGTVGGASASQAYDITNLILYVCTTTGTAATAVWTQVGGSAFTGNEDVKTASYTIVLADAGRIQTANSAAAITFTLTAASTIGAGKVFGIKNIGAGALTISPSGSDKIDALANLILIQNQGIILYSTGSGWRILSSTWALFDTVGTASFPAEITVASAATCNILGAASEAIAISGTTTITSFGTGTNRRRLCRATGAFTITYNATSLITPGAQNITTVAGDTFIVVSDASSNARIVNYQQGTAGNLLLSAPEVTVASAATCNILGAASEAVAISGTTTITSFGTGINRVRFCRATGSFTITQNATSLICPGSVSIVTQVGDTWIVISDASSNARIVNYQAVGSAPATGFTGQLFGLTVSNDSGGTTALAIAAGSARDSTDVDFMVLGSALTGKVLANAWSVGSAGGLLDTGAIANNTYHIWLIKRTDTGVVDALASLSASAPVMPANYTEKRRIGSVIRTGGAIVLFTQLGDWFYLTTPPLDLNTTTLGAARTLFTLSAPPNTTARIRARTGGTNSIVVQPTAETDAAPSATVTPLRTFDGTASDATFDIPVDGSSQIAARADGASSTLRAVTLAWMDQRGRLY